MRVLCLERDNVTQLCDPDSDGDVYTSSFELFPFHEGATYSVYLGVYNGNGPYAGQFCAVRCLLDVEAGPAHWQGTINRAREARRLAHEFNKELAYPAVFFNVPVMTRMETVSDFNALFRCFRPHDKRLRHGECVTLEPYLEGNFRQFDLPSSGQVKTGPPPGQIGEPDVIEPVPTEPVGVYATKHRKIQSTSSIAQAFTHFTWHVTGSHIVCGLQGSLSGLTYTLTNPQIHSLGARFGAADGSSMAIAEFFRQHRCNNICRGWDRYAPGTNTLPQVNFLYHPASLPRLHSQQRQQQLKKDKNHHQQQPLHHQDHQQQLNLQPAGTENCYDSYTNIERSLPSAPAPSFEENPISSFV